MNSTTDNFWTFVDDSHNKYWLQHKKGDGNSVNK